MQRLAPRWFVMRDAHARDGVVLMQPRWTMSFMRGPMTRSEIQLALATRGGKSASRDDDANGTLAANAGQRL